MSYLGYILQHKLTVKKQYNGEVRCVICGNPHVFEFPDDFPDHFKLCCACVDTLKFMINYSKERLISHVETVYKNHHRKVPKHFYLYIEKLYNLFTVMV